MLKRHVLLALTYFFIVAFLGALLRLFYVVNVPVNYKHIVHTHSHIALLGWVYTAITTLIYKLFLADKPIEKKYKVLFWITQITIIGMLVSFPITGYALFSIIFSTLFILVSYWFVWFFIKHTTIKQKQTLSYKCIRMALWYMVISSIGPWALGVIMNTLGNTSVWYKNAIYFYLHFQYNGWFIVALLGVFIFVLEKCHIHLPKKMFKLFFLSLNIGVVLSYFLSVLWMQPNVVYYFLAGAGVVLKALAFVVLIIAVLPFMSHLKKHISIRTLQILGLVFVFLCIKICMQFLGAIPYVASQIATNIDFVIGYLHWTFLGVISITLFVFLHHFRILYLSRKAFVLYLIGFLLTEGLIFYKGIVIWLEEILMNNYFMILAFVSCFFPMALGYLLIEQTIQKNEKS